MLHAVRAEVRQGSEVRAVARAAVCAGLTMKLQGGDGEQRGDGENSTAHGRSRGSRVVEVYLMRRAVALTQLSTVSEILHSPPPLFRLLQLAHVCIYCLVIPRRIS